MKHTVLYVTSNELKFQVARHIFEKTGLSDSIELEQASQVSLSEIQAESSVDVALRKASDAYRVCGVSCIVSDSSFHIPALNGFPGPFVKFINRWLTAKKILLMLEQGQRVEAFYDDVRVYVNAKGESYAFHCTTHGHVDPAVRDISGKGVDSIFIPDGFDVPLSSLQADDLLSVWDESGWWELKAHLGV